MRRVIVDCKSGDAYVETLNAAEDAALEVERAPLKAAADAQRIEDDRESVLRVAVRAHLDDLVAAAAAVEAGTATPAEQRSLLVQTTRMTVRLARLYLRQLDQAP